MRLTGKSLKDFKKWLDNEFDVDEQPIRFYQDHADVETYASEHFEILPFSMQYGVLVDWFFSVSYPININLIEYGFDADKTIYKCEVTIGFRDVGFFENNTQARQKAIEKANEIYNNR